MLRYEEHGSRKMASNPSGALEEMQMRNLIELRTMGEQEGIARSLSQGKACYREANALQSSQNRHFL